MNVNDLRPLLPGTRVDIHGNIRTVVKVESRDDMHPDGGAVCLHLDAPIGRRLEPTYRVSKWNVSEVRVVPSADIRVLRTAFRFDIVENSSWTITARDIEDDRPVRWFVPHDGSDPVPCPRSMQRAVDALTARHCEVPGYGRPGQRVLITYTNPFEYEEVA